MLFKPSHTTTGYATLLIIITHIDGSHASIAIICICDSVCPHDKTKMAQTKITKLGTGAVHQDTLPTS